MSELRPLRGGCQCGRNRYIIALPSDATENARVHFNTDASHQVPLATPLAAYLRVPLSWYHSTTFALFPDETHTMIRRVYSPPNHDNSKRQFCGFCGTPLSYWCEEPLSEASFINLTLGSLLQDDLRDLEDLGLIPEASSEGDEEEEEEEGGEGTAEASTTEKQATKTSPGRNTALRESYGVPWFDGLVEGTRLGRMRRTQGIRKSGDGKVRVEWEVVEYNGGDEDQEMDMGTGSSGNGKRKRESTDAAGLQQQGN